VEILGGKSRSGRKWIENTISFGQVKQHGSEEKSPGSLLLCKKRKKSVIEKPDVFVL
jgi:hypothetical protein